MTLTDIIVIAVIGVVVGLAVAYVVKAKRSGNKCIGCPHSGKCTGCCSTCENNEKNN